MEVVAFVVEALLVMKLELFPKRVEMYEEVKFAIEAKRVPSMFVFVKDDVAASS